MNISKAIAGVGVVALVMTSVAGLSAYAKENPHKSANAVCMQNAIEKRENSVIMALNTYHATLVRALETRRDALKAAVQDKPAEKAAMEAFRISRKNASDAFKIAQKSASSVFTVERKACK